jgi:cytokinin dehydrogenase
MRESIGWDALIKPWFDVWLPDSVVEGYVVPKLANLTARDVGSAGFILLFAQQRSRMQRPFFRLPAVSAETDWVWLFDILGTSTIGNPDPTFVRDMLARNWRLFEEARALGGIRYPIGALDFTREDWVQHYGELWPEVARCKQRFDPDNILTPGPGIF